MKKNIYKKLLFFCILFIGVFFLFQLQVNAYCCVGKNNDSGDSDFNKTISSECKEIQLEKFDEKACAKKYPGSADIRYELHNAYTCCDVDGCAQSNNKPCPTPTTSGGTTQPTKEEDKFEPIEPRLQIDIPTVQFSKITKEGQMLGIPFLAEYVAGVFKYAVGIISIVAIVMIMVGGLIWLTAGGSAERVGKAKETITGAVLGLILALGSYTVLYAINPDLVSFKNLRIKLIKREIIETIEDVSNDPLILNAQTACNSIDSCKILCAKDPSEWPDAVAGMATPSQIKTIPDTTGIKSTGGGVLPSVITALQSVGAAADQKGYQIQINNGYRPLADQIKKVCDKIKAGKELDVGKMVAWPGGSRHGMGIAIDVYIVKDGVALPGEKMSENLINELEEIMRVGGFVRYCREWWHFELGTAGSPCRPKNLNSYCPKPYAEKSMDMKCK